jgi:hypothetical protein
MTTLDLSSDTARAMELRRPPHNLTYKKIGSVLGVSAAWAQKIVTQANDGEEVPRVITWTRKDLNAGRRATRIQEGTCLKCGREDARPGLLTGAECARKAKGLYEARAANGKCISCRDDARPDQKTCQSCSDAATKRAALIYTQRIEHGQCGICGDPAAIGDLRSNDPDAVNWTLTVCAKHADVNRNRSR